MIRAKKSLGQNFLIDKEVLKKIVNTTAIENKTILEIGPGTGNLTSCILKNSPKKMYVVEKDDDLVKYLDEIFKDQLTVINKEILSVDENSLFNKLKDLYLELENRNLSKSNLNQNDNFYILNPKFSLVNLSARHNIDRLIWLKNGQQYKDIIASDSPYRIHPDIKKCDPIANLKWDIKNNRVIQAPNNTILLWLRVNY